ncbi:uncharacterized protein LOC115028453 isoform X2 [Cottoperca gobio]|nr:uncharacterized protein LOC115028453 isoform X2 [Cottoperca gobio]
MTKVSATCTKNEDGRPVVAKAVPGLTWDEVTEKQLSSMFNGSLSEDTYKSLRLNIHNNLDDEGQVPGVSWALKHVIEKGDAALKPVEAVGSDSVQDMTDVSEDLQTRSSSVVSQNITLEPTSLMENQDAKKNIDDQQHYTNIYSSVDEIQIHNVVSIPTNYSDGLSNLRSSEGARKNACSVLSQTDLSLALSENEVKSHAPLSEVPFVKQYEDITDDESQLSNTEHEELSFLAGLEDSQHDEESPPECMAVASSTQVREPTDEQSPFENEGAGHVTKWDSERPSNSVSCSPFSCCDDDDDEDYMLCIPLTISDLTFESEDEDQDRHEKNVLDGGETGDPVTLCYSSPTHCQSLKQVLASVSSPLKVFDTPASFCEAMRPKKICEASGWSSHKHEMDSEGERPAPQNKRESVESCDTEDSCDYSSATENNYLTVSRKLLKKRAAPKLSDDSGSESEGYEGTYVQQGQTSTVDMSGCMQRHSPQIEAKDCCSKDVQPKTNGLNIPKNEDIIIISDSDDESDQSEDESDQSEDESGKKQTKRKRLFSSSSEDSVSPSSQQRHWPKTVDSLCGTVEEKFKINRLPSAESPATKRQSKCFDTPVEEEMLDAYSNLSRSTGKSGELFKTKAASAHIQHKTNSIIVIDPDTENDDNDDEKPSRKRFLSSGSDSDQKRRSHKTVDSDYEIAKEKHQETRPSSADTSNSRHQSKLHNTQHKTTRPTTTKRRVVFHDSDKEVKKSHFRKKKASTKRIHSSGSEDCGNELFATKNRRLTETDDRLCRDANEKAKKSRLSFEDSPEKQSQSVDKKADSTLGSNPVIPRLAFVKPSQPNKDLLTLFKEPRDGTLSPKASTASSKKTYSLEKEFKLLKPKPANDGQHAIKNNVQANVQKQYRRQLSLPMQEGSSTSFMSSIGKLSEARQSSSSRDLSGENTTSSRLPASKQSTSIPRHSSSSKLQRSLSYTNPSTPNSSCTPTKSPSPMQSSASKQVAKVWKNGYFPTRKDKKSEENLRTRNDHHDGARILSNNSHKSATPMMKKAKCDAIQLTKARSRDVPRKRRYYGGEGYKWSEK